MKLVSVTLHRTIGVLLVGIAVVLLLGHTAKSGTPPLSGAALVVAGDVAGFGIGVVASLLGVAGGELLWPKLSVLYVLNLKLSGSLRWW